MSFLISERKSPEAILAHRYISYRIGHLMHCKSNEGFLYEMHHRTERRVSSLTELNEGFLYEMHHRTERRVSI